MTNYIVYVYLDPRKLSDLENFVYEPFYVGEGKPSRRFVHLKDKSISHKTNRINSIISDNLHPIITIFKEHLTKDEAVNLETNLIKAIGTRAIIEGVKRGPLTNLKLYGKLGLISTETKEKMSIAKKGIKFSDLHRAALSKARIGKSYSRVASGPLSMEHKLKLSNAMKGRSFSEESIKRMSESQKGRLITDSHKKKLSDACKGRASPNTKEWNLEFKDGRSIIIKSLVTWCKENGIIPNSLRNTLHSGKFHKGVKLLKI